MTTPRIFDMLRLDGTNGYLGAGSNYQVTTIASPPARFIDDFTKASLAAAGSVTGPQVELYACAKVSFQVIVATVGASFTKLTLQLQGSNVGGTDAAVWTSVGNAVEPATTGSVFLNGASDAVARTKFYRVTATSVGDASTFYCIGFGYSES